MAKIKEEVKIWAVAESKTTLTVYPIVLFLPCTILYTCMTPLYTYIVSYNLELEVLIEV